MMSGPGLEFDLGIEPAVILYALALSIAAGLSFGLAPALAATRTSLAQALHSEGMAGAPRSSRRVWTARNALVIVPLGVSLMLLLAAGIALRRVQRNYLEGPQFEAAHLVAASFRLNMQGYDRARTMRFQDDLRRRIAIMPGVTATALATAMPLSNMVGWRSLVVAGAPPSTDAASPHADYNAISHDYFETVGARIVRGRGFTALDREGSSPVVLVNEQFVRRYWPDSEAIGRRIRLLTADTYFEVVGVAPDLQDASNPDSYVRPMVYVALAQAPLFLKGLRTDPPPYQAVFLARTSGEPKALKALIRQEAHAADASLRVTTETVEESLEARNGLKLVSEMLSALGGLALLMAAVGIYAIMAYAVSQRTREIGIRTALGAQRREIVALVMRRTLVLIAWGIGAGLFGGLALTRIFARSMSKMGELDAPTCVAVSAFLAAAAILASYLPARKALRVDPVQALRCE
jgi:predicted permease